MKNASEVILLEVQDWLEKVVIGINLCPFARTPYLQNRIRFSLCRDNRKKSQWNFLLKELEIMNLASPVILETSIIVFPSWRGDFLGFFDFVSQYEDLLESECVGQEFQVVVFHPDFYFQGMDKDETVNLVNRSPYPLVHLLRKSSISQLELTQERGEQISRENEQRLKSLSSSELDQLFGYLRKKHE